MKNAKFSHLRFEPIEELSKATQRQVVGGSGPGCTHPPYGGYDPSINPCILTGGDYECYEPGNQSNSYDFCDLWTCQYYCCETCR